MPIYEFTCGKCSAKFDQLVKSMSSTDPIKCPQCGSEKTSRALSVFAVSANSGKSSQASSPGMCGRCGGPGPCGMN
jgi:putative FmdB family regulatory protein